MSDKDPALSTGCKVETTLPNVCEPPVAGPMARRWLHSYDMPWLWHEGGSGEWGTCVRLEVQLLDKDPDTGLTLYPKLPFRSRDTDAGYDLYAAENACIQPGRSKMIRTGIIIAAPPGFYYTIEGRSSLWMKGVHPHRGIIDATYCGQVVVSLVNVSGEEFHIQRHDRIAQIVLHKQYHAHFLCVEEFSPQYNQRGTNGFGSTGK